MFNINFGILAQRFTPYFLRKPAFVNWVIALFSPLQTLNINVVAWRERMVKYLSYDGMTVHMERYLNGEYIPNVYNPNQRNEQITAVDIIYIDTTANNALRYVYNKAELNPPIYLYNDSEASAPEYFYNLAEAPTFPCFTVYVPTSLGGTYEVNGTQDNNLLRSRINLFRLAGFTNYLIIRY